LKGQDGKEKADQSKLDLTCKEEESKTTSVTQARGISFATTRIGKKQKRGGVSLGRGREKQNRGRVVLGNVF